MPQSKPRSKRDIPPVTAERVRELFEYRPHTGELIRRVAVGKHGRHPAGTPIVSHPTKSGHLRVMIDHKHYLLHRVVWLHVTGVWPKDILDHKDGDPANNRWCNLREADRGQNVYNRPPRSDNAAGISGVCWNRRKSRWMAEIKADGRRHFLGYFDSVDEASAARRAAEIRLFGEYAYSREQARPEHRQISVDSAQRECLADGIADVFHHAMALAYANRGVPAGVSIEWLEDLVRVVIYDVGGRAISSFDRRFQVGATV